MSQVVPFSPHAGLLEWVDGTVSLSQYLFSTAPDGGQGAHARYARQVSEGGGPGGSCTVRETGEYECDYVLLL